jgi:hypothetical protein
MIRKNQEMRPPFAHLGFYYSDIRGTEAFHRVYSYLVSRGAVSLGKFCIEQRRESEKPPFSHKVGWPTPISKIVQTSNPESLFTDSNIRVHFCYLLNAVGSRENTEEMLALVNISEVALQYDNHPIELVVDNSEFTPVRFMTEAQLDVAYKAGTREYQTFIDIIEATKPSYATNTSEESIECPTDLEYSESPTRFENFYISFQYFADEKVRQEVLKLYEGAYIQELSEGIYISSWQFLNPEKLNWNPDLEKRKQANEAIIRLIIQKHKTQNDT